MSRALIYLDKGVSLNSFQHSIMALQRHFPQYEIEVADHRTFLTPSWEDQASLIIFPGGRDLPYHQALKGEANSRIKAFICNGGHFLGICAGGYYGASFIEFEKGGPLEVCGERELAFFPGKAIGPIYEKGLFDYESEAGARAARLSWGGTASYVYYNGGCLFEEAELYPEVKVLARYEDLPGQPAAAVYCHLGKGGALLTGVHPEFSKAEDNSFFAYLIKQINLYNLNFSML